VSLPLLISVPHAGVLIPEEVNNLCLLSHEEIIDDGDEGAGKIYDFPSEVKLYLTTDIARAIIDLNRAPDDFRPDGVIKTHTCWNKQVYSTFPDADLQKLLLDKYYYPYHQRLQDLAESDVILGIDCHTMAEFGPPIGPGSGQKRPMICVSNGGSNCPEPWFELMFDCLQEEFGEKVKANDPFKGGYIIRNHSDKLPWLQLEISRSNDLSITRKREKILNCLQKWCHAVN
jgi:formiminoglutamase